MTALVDKLGPILALERRQGYANRAVQGGLEQYLAALGRQIADLPPDESERTERVISDLKDYARMSPAARRIAVEQAVARDAFLANLPGAMRPSDADEPSATEPDGGGTPGSVRRAPVKAPPGEHASPPAAAPRAPRQPKPPASLDSPLVAIKGVGKTLEESLARLELRTVRDLLYHIPRRYDDYTRWTQVSHLTLGDECTVAGQVRRVHRGRTSRGLAIVSVYLQDSTGTVEARWFGQSYLAGQFKPGDEVVLSGRVDQSLGRLILNAPEWEPRLPEQLHTGRLVPVYPLTSGISARRLRTLTKATVDAWAPQVPDPLPADMRRSLSLMDLGEALRQVHFPDSWDALAAARRRLCFDEFLFLQLGMFGQRQQRTSQVSVPLDASRAGIEAFVSGLSFQLTGAQQRAIADILADIGKPSPMRRLLQGDVGSGKTVVAVAALLAAVRNGYQAAVMVPTSILAEQHYRSISAMLARCPDVRCTLLTGALSTSERERIHAEARSGNPQVFIGTHALIQKGVDLPRLGLVVVDEQHRFGVAQRSTLSERSANLPHVLAMSATPIPRSLAMTIYGDLDISVLDEVPPGRQRIITAVRGDAHRERIYAFMGEQVAAGRQCFVVCPLIDESQGTDRSAVAEYERLRTTVFRRFRLGLLHGRMAADEKDRAMERFQQGALDILVCTTVVEVGIDIPNATVMLIENAGGFGLAQLHQLRGRVGRGTGQSWCILLSEEDSEAALQRLRIMEDTADGFRLAEEDLHMRGPGDFFGLRQHGLPTLRVADLSDTAVLELARSEAARVFAADPELSQAEHADLAAGVRRFWASEDAAA